MSASAWDRAVEASVATLNREEWSSALPGYCLSETVLAAALPVLLEELAGEIAGHVPHIHGLTSRADECPDCQWIVWAARLVRGFAAEVTK